MKALIKKLRRRLRRSKGHAKAWARWVAQRLTGEPGYVESVVSLGAVLIELFCRSRAVRRIAREAADAVFVLLNIYRNADPRWATAH